MRDHLFMKVKNSLNWFIFFLVLYEFNVYMANDLIMPGMLNVVQEFHASEDVIPLSMSLYILGGILLPFFVGPASDKIGRRPMMIAGCLFFLICTLAILSSTSIHTFLLAKFFQGMGLCFIGVCGYASVQELFEEKKAVRVISWMTGTAILAPVIGPIAGGFFVQEFHWRWIFGFTLAVASISLWGIGKFMPESVNLDFNFPKDQKGSFWSSLAFKVKLLGTISFVPTLRTYRRLLSNRKLVLGAALNGLIASPTLSWIAISPIILFKNSNVSANLYGIVQIPVFGLYILGGFFLRLFSHRLGLTQLIQLGFPFYFLGIMGIYLACLFYPDSYWSIILPLSLSCFGNGIIGSPLNRQALFSTTEKKGIASAVYNFVSMLILIGAVSSLPLIFKGRNFDFAIFSLVYGLMTLTVLFLYLKVPDKEISTGL